MLGIAKKRARSSLERQRSIERRAQARTESDVTKVAKRSRVRNRGAVVQASSPISAEQGRYRLVITITAVLYLFGLVMVASASSGTSLLYHGDSWGFLQKQLIYGIIGFGAFLAVMRASTRMLRVGSTIVLGMGIVLLFAVFIPGVGMTVNGATRWISLGPLSMQPSELVKIGVILYLASYLASTRVPATTRDLIRSPGGIAFFLCAVIFIQRDLGSALVMGCVVMSMYVVAGINWKMLMQTLGPAIVLVIVGIASEEFRRQRFLAFIDPWADPQGSGFQLVQGLVAIGSGGPFGVGLGHSVQKIHYVPEAHTDMIYSIIAEELGLVGIAIVLVCFASLILVGMRIAMNSRTRFGALVAVGVTAMIGCQAVLNMSGVVGVLPLTGVPLPLVSYGGTSLIVTLMSLGLLANVAVARNDNAHDTAHDT